MLNPKLCSGAAVVEAVVLKVMPIFKETRPSWKIKRINCRHSLYIMVYYAVYFFVPAFFNKLLLMLC